MKHDIISSISHELRTPLTSIGGWTETLMVGGMEDRGLALKGLAIINKESHRLSQMVEELLDFARLEGGRMKLHSERFDLRGELADAAFIYTDLCKRDGITMQYDEGEEPVPVFGDKDRLRQVFLNILDNAAKYSGPGGKIELAVGQEGDKALVVIRDHGPGIPAADLPYIKDKFYRGTAPKKRGAGIGLSVCDEIVKLHGGTLTIESEEGEGTHVSIRLPLAPAEKPPEA